MKITKKHKSLKFLELLLCSVVMAYLLAGCQSATLFESNAANLATKSSSTATASPTNPTEKTLNQTATSTPPQESFQTRLLKGIPCVLPCVEGITPGVTTVKEAYNLLKNNPLVSNVQLNEKYQTIMWSWHSKIRPVGGYIGSYENNNKIVEYIKVDLESDISPQDVAPLFGTPTHILAKASPNYSRVDIGAAFYSLYLVYDSNGIILTRSKLTDDPPQLTEKVKLNLLTTYKPNGVGISEVGILKHLGLTAWQGYKPFVEYCKAHNWPTENRRYCR